MRKLLCIFVCLATPSVSLGAIAWNISYGPNVPAAAQTSTQQAADHISSLIAGSTILDVSVTFDPLGSGVLGGATPVYPTSVSNAPGFTLETVSATKIKGGADNNAGADDIVVAMGNAIDWGYGRNSIASNEISFFDTMVHELIHSIGFLEVITQSGQGYYGFQGLTAPGGGPTPPAPGTDADLFGPYDQFIGDATGTIISPTGVVDKARWDSAVIGGTGTNPTPTNGLYYYGPNAMAENGGNPVPLYSPNPYETGSSVGHVDTNFFSSGTFIMNHAAGDGEHTGTLKPLELAIMRDAGFSLVAVPEPSAFLFLVLIACMLQGWNRFRYVRTDLR